MSILNLTTLSVIAGTAAGGIAFSELLNFLPKTIGEVLEFEGKQILDSQGNKHEEEWLVLAQRYREHGTVTPGQDRDFTKQTNPGFLSSSDWSTYVHQNATSNDKNKNVGNL